MIGVYEVLLVLLTPVLLRVRLRTFELIVTAEIPKLGRINHHSTEPIEHFYTFRILSKLPCHHINSVPTSNC